MMKEPMSSSARIANIKYQTCLDKDIVCSNNKTYKTYIIKYYLCFAHFKFKRFII